MNEELVQDVISRLRSRQQSSRPDKDSVTRWQQHRLLCPPLIGGGIKRCFCPTSDVCLSRTSGVRREQRPRKIKIGTEVAHVTSDSDTTFNVKRSKVKGQGHQAALLTAVLAHQAAAAVGMGTCWPWKTTSSHSLSFDIQDWLRDSFFHC